MILNENLGLGKKIDKLEKNIRKALAEAKSFSPESSEEKKINSYLKERLPKMLNDVEEMRKVNNMSDEEIENKGLTKDIAKKKLKNTVKKFKEFSTYCNDSVNKMIVKKIIGAALWTFFTCGLGGIISGVLGYGQIQRKRKGDKEGIGKFSSKEFFEEYTPNYFPY